MTVRDLYYSFFPETKKYLEFRKGNTNLLLSAPHGGNIRPRTIPNRTYGNRSGDTYTRRLIKKIIKNLEEKPYYVYADIHRSKVDLNRDIEEAAQGNMVMESVWREWNKIISMYLGGIKLRYFKGLYIDIHSHNKSDNFELGYGISVADYWNIKENKSPKKHSTLFQLANERVNETDLLFGEFSFDSTLRSYDYKVLSPKSDDTYLNGGRNINKYSKNGIGTIQIECPIPVLKKDLNNIALVITEAIENFKYNLM